MKIAAVDLFTYRLPLKQPLVLSAGTTDVRRGYLIKLTSESGAIGWGDVAPLPGFSAESPEEVRTVLTRLRRGLFSTTISTGNSGLPIGFEAEGLGGIRELSVRCGVEMAALNLLAADAGVSFAGLLSDCPAEEILLNGLITDGEDTVECARRLKGDGFRSIKLKVGRGRIAEDIERVRSVRRELGDDIALRLDANRAWSLDEAMEFADGVADCRIEYIEEPLADPTRLAEFHASSGIALALDESVLNLSPDDLHKHEYAEAVVLKPTLLGGFESAGALARAARELGMKVVISSCFESSVGIAALAQFAAAYGQTNVAAGLDTLDRFEQDLLAESIDSSGGRINIAQASRAAHSVDETRLDRMRND